MNKGQFVGQIFIYVLAVIITAIVLGYGYKAVVTFKEKSDQVSYIQFKTNLQNDIESITSDFGTVEIKLYSIPLNFKEVCFVKNYPSLKTLSNTEHPIIEDSVNSKVEKNVFLVENIAKDSFYAGKIDVEKDLYCINTANGKLRLRLEGMGDHTKIEKENLV